MDFIFYVSEKVNLLLGDSFIKNPWVILIVLCVFVFALFLFVKYRLWNLSQKIEEKIVYYYDNLFYMLANAKNKNVIKDEWFDIFSSLATSDNANYIQNRDKIYDDVKKIENKISMKIVPDSLWEQINRLYKKMKIKKFFGWLLKMLLLIIILFFVLLLVCVVIAK